MLKNIDRQKAIDNVDLLLQCLAKHCEWCADCDWDNNPDPECGYFAEMWLKIRKEKEHESK